MTEWWCGKASAAAAAAAAKSLQSCPSLCDPLDGSPPGSPIPGILQARTLEWVAIFFSNAWKWKGKVKLLSHPTLSDPMECSPPGSSTHGIFQARVLEWGARAFSKGHCCWKSNVMLLTVPLEMRGKAHHTGTEGKNSQSRAQRIERKVWAPPLLGFLWVRRKAG